MSISKKIKAINNKIKKYDLDRQATKISALSSGNVIKHDFLTEKGVFLKKDLLKKAATLKTFEYSPLDKE